MADHTSLPVKPATKDRLAAHKRDGESWDACLQRLLDELDDPGGDGTGGGIDEVLGRLDDLQATIPERTADELQSRMR